MDRDMGGDVAQDLAVFELIVEGVGSKCAWLTHGDGPWLLVSAGAGFRDPPAISS